MFELSENGVSRGRQDRWLENTYTRVLKAIRRGKGSLMLRERGSRSVGRILGKTSLSRMIGLSLIVLGRRTTMQRLFGSFPPIR